jgi:histidinol-phosphate aminotransferase
MVVSLNENAQQDLMDRGFSRRNFGKIAALLGAAAAAPAA